MTSPRYAIYFAPHSESRLWRFGSTVVGYDAYQAAEIDQPSLDGLSPSETRAITESARRYGFHATLKAPFRLAEDRTAEELIEACGAFAAERNVIQLSHLVVESIGGFNALVAGEPTPALDALAADAVRAFDGFRAPPTEAERARRRPERLNERQLENLDMWGYPYIFEDFQFHMTLTDSIEDDAIRANVLTALRESYEAVEVRPVPIDAIALFEQAETSGRFVILGRFLLQP